MPIIRTAIFVCIAHLVIIFGFLSVCGMNAGNQSPAKSCDMLIYRDGNKKKREEDIRKHIYNKKMVRRHSDFQRHKSKLISPKKKQAGKQLHWL